MMPEFGDIESPLKRTRQARVFYWPQKLNVVKHRA
jgi:hypothetical protein